MKTLLQTEVDLRGVRLAAIARVILFSLLLVGESAGQPFSSGSTGVDGALTYATSGTYDFVPTGLDADGDGIFHFNSVFIASGVTLRFRADLMPNRPVIWLVSGDVNILGTLNLDGSNGHSSSALFSNAVPGPGGYYGGWGNNQSTGFTAQPGQGPGGGKVATATSSSAGGAGFAVAGTAGRSSSNVVGGPGAGEGGGSYGNRLLIPLVGGSGGAGGGFGATSGGGGGAGGGAILIASSSNIYVNGAIQALGGNAGSSSCGGGGSGGAIRLMAPTLQLPGSLSAYGGNGNSSCVSGSSAGGGSVGRIRVEGTITSGGTSSNPPMLRSSLSSVFPSGMPQVRVSTVAGTAVPPYPAAGTNPADVTIDQSGPVVLGIDATRIPLGTVVQLRMMAEDGTVLDATSTPLVGSFDESSATATVTIPFGISRFSVYATWAQP